MTSTPMDTNSWTSIVPRLRAGPLSGDPVFEDAADYILALEQRERDLENRAETAEAIVTELVAIIPLRDVLAVSRTGHDLVNYYKTLHTSAEAAEKERDRLRQAIDDYLNGNYEGWRQEYGDCDDHFRAALEAKP